MERSSQIRSSAVSRTPSPSSCHALHSASVHVMELSSPSNPVPVGREEARGEVCVFSDDYLSPMKLRDLTGESDLTKVTYLQISVNTMSSSLGNFGSSVPSLTELRCVDSQVGCVRDLGTGLARLTVLWLPHCGLRDLDGLPSLNSLSELYISHNLVSDVSVAAMLPSLKVLDIESNQLSDEDQLGFLGLCLSLSSLSLTGNPLAHTLTNQQGGETGYRAVVVMALPHLRVLDDVSVSILSPSSSHSTQSLALKDSLQADLSTGGGARQPSPHHDDSSDLTHGVNHVICGNPVRALRARRRHGLSSQSAVTLASPARQCSASSSLATLMEGLSVTMGTTSPSEPVATSSQSEILPSPPPSLPPTTARPHSATADLRHRRYHRPSPVSPAHVHINTT